MMVTRHPKDVHPPERLILQTWNLALVTELTKLRPGYNWHGWLPTIPRMFTHQPKDGHPPEESIEQTRFLEISLKSEN